MKRLAILSALILGVVLASALAQDEATQPAAEPEQPAAAPPADPATEAALQALMGGGAAPEVSEADISYALGFIIGNDLKGQGIQLKDTEQFAQGVQAGLGTAEPRMSPQQINAAMNAFAMNMREEILATKQASQEYLTANAEKEGVTTTESGLQIKTLKEGEGDAPKEGDVVTVEYEGKLIDGTVFDESAPDQPLVWDPRQFGVIPGWVEGLPLMKEGGEYELTVPSELAYGDRPNGQIPGGSVLVFKIKLIDTETPADDPAAGMMPAQPMPPAEPME